MALPRSLAPEGSEEAKTQAEPTPGLEPGTPSLRVTIRGFGDVRPVALDPVPTEDSGSRTRFSVRGDSGPLLPQVLPPLLPRNDEGPRRLRKRRARARGGAGAHTRRRRAYAAGAAGPAQWRFRGHRSEHLADITWDAHVRATAGAECRKRIRLRHAGVVHRSSLRARPVGGGSPLSARRSAGGCPRCRSRT
jgi:hypothetical protein